MYSLTPWIALGIALTVTTAVWITILDLDKQTKKVEFDSITEQATQQIVAKLKTHEQVLMGFEGLFSASQLVETIEFTHFYDIQKIDERFPDNQGVGYIEYVNGENEKSELIERLQNEGIEFTIYPEGQRSEYYPVVFLEPQDLRNKRAIGYDINSEIKRQHALNLAKESGMITLTEKITLVQETDEDIQNGFLMLLPVYEYVEDGKDIQKFQGFIYGVFRMNDFVSETIPSSIFENIQIKIYDGVFDLERIFFDSQEIGGFVDRIEFSNIDVIDFGGRQWLIEYQGIFPTNSQQDSHTMVPILGYSMSFLLFYTLVLFSKNTRLTEKMLKKEKISLVGELSSRFAHDIRNPLSNIQMSIDMLQKNEKLNQDSKIQEKFQIISKNLERIAHQVDDVLGFVRSRPLEKKPINLKLCLSETLESINIPENIRIIFSDNNVSILGDAFQLQIVFKNLITNAIQSIGEKEGKIAIRLNDDHKNAVIEIEDSGPGFSKIPLEEIFEPLTTTKQIGTGLGLVSCKQIIDSHNGTISVKVNPTTFTIRIPKK